MAIEPSKQDTVQRQCAWCARPFWTRAFLIRQGQGRFCTQRCAKAHRSEQTDKDESILARLEKYTIRRGDDECWSWTAFKHRGYGRLRIKTGAAEGAHRISYRLRVGPIPDGMTVLHRCDNPECTNPRHLFLGTNIDNNLDRDRKGRAAKGEKAGKAKLTTEAVLIIRAMHPLTAERVGELSERFGVQRQTIHAVAARETWRHVA